MTPKTNTDKKSGQAPQRLPATRRAWHQARILASVEGKGLAELVGILLDEHWQRALGAGLVVDKMLDQLAAQDGQE